MNKTRKIFALILSVLLAVSVLCGSGFAALDKTELSEGLYQLSVVYRVKMSSLAEDSYTAWTCAMCFAAGKTEDGTVYFITDAALSKPDRLYEEVGDQLLQYLSNGGISVGTEDLPTYAVVTDTEYYITDNGAYIKLVPVSQSVSPDLMVLKLAAPDQELTTTAFTYSYADVLREGDKVYTFSLSGTDISGVVPSSQDTYVTLWSLASHEETVQYPATIEDGNHALTYYTLAPNRGAQGGALFNSSGYVVGVNLWTSAYEGTTALTSSAAMAVLDQLKVPYEVYEPVSNNFSFADIQLYVIILGAVILLLIILLIIVRIRRKKYDADDVSDLEREAQRAREELSVQKNRYVPAAPAQRRAAPEAQPRPEQREPAQQSRPVQKAPVQQREARPAAQERPAPQPAAAPNAARPAAAAAAATAARPQQPAVPKNVSVYVLGGTLQGQSFPVTDKVTIGRDPATCDIVFPADTTAVSRRHCSVTFNAQLGRVLLQDLDSSNGTYFPSGNRVIPRRLYSLRNGDRFYLGLPDNLLAVRIEYSES